MPGAAGISLVEVMIALAILSVGAVIVSSSAVSVLVEERSETAAKASGQLGDTVLKAIVTQLNGASSACFAPSSIGSLPLSTYGTMSYFTGGTSLPSNAPATHAAALTRCASPRQPASYTAMPAAYSFCVRLRPTGSTPPTGTFFDSTYAFAEVSLQLLNLQTNAPVSCQTYNTTAATSGALASYTIYWGRVDKQAAIFKTPTGVAYVGH